MQSLRFKALQIAQLREIIEVKATHEQVSAYFGTNVFGIKAMKNHLSAATYKKLTYVTTHGTKVDAELADAVASAMKSWAMIKGATHYTHWFQPLTGATAEKHDAFFELNAAQGEVIEEFKGTALVQQEPDASSFPSGGIRNTFEARGYTAWDPTSPAFIIETNGGKTLCIPTIFVSYTGEALDYKTPMLKALTFMDRAATAVCQLFDKNIKKVTATLGIEQEYFLVDKALYNARMDLMLVGRTVFGHAPAKGQQLEDHYFGSIPPRVINFMKDFEIEALKLGIPVRTRHNEVAPGQFECAPAFEEANLAIDHNLLLMDVMEKVADKHNFKVLFHEKPFAGVNGSGKHNNWSLVTDKGKNLLSPSSKAKENLQFLTFFINIIKAVHDHADLLRASIASAGNEHRLGGNEAPPSIISVFIGSQLTTILNELEQNAKIKVNKGENLYMKLGIDKIPPILMDNTDRNRTSPFAFTGNKFEFRAVGSSANCASNMIILNTIVANQLVAFTKDVAESQKKHKKLELAIIYVLRDYIKSAKNILFEGNGYAQAWMDEATKRGLTNIMSCPQALDALVDKSAIQLFEKHHIFSEREVHARHEILLENYIKKIQIEAGVIQELVLNQIIPTTITYQNKLIENITGLKELGLEPVVYQHTLDLVKNIAAHVQNARQHVETMMQTQKKADDLQDLRKKAQIYSTTIKNLFDTIRTHVDALEMLIDDQTWSLPKYRELLWTR